VPVIGSKSCDLRVLMDQPTKVISSHHPPRRRQNNGLAGLEWRRLPQRAVWAVAVVMVDILGQYRPQLPAAQDQHPIQDLPPNRAHPPLRVGVGPRRPHRRAQHLDPSSRPSSPTAGVPMRVVCPAGALGFRRLPAKQPLRDYRPIQRGDRRGGRVGKGLSREAWLAHAVRQAGGALPGPAPGRRAGGPDRWSVPLPGR
jgi:hypothetical protein